MRPLGRRFIEHAQSSSLKALFTTDTMSASVSEDKLIFDFVAPFTVIVTFDLESPSPAARSSASTMFKKSEREPGALAVFHHFFFIPMWVLPSIFRAKNMEVKQPYQTLWLFRSFGKREKQPLIALGCICWGSFRLEDGVGTGQKVHRA